MMTQNEFLEQILGFSKPWHIERVEQDDDKVEIRLNYPKGTRFICTRCGKENTAYDNKWKSYRHLDWWQYKTFIKVKVPRVKCCNKAETIEIPWLRRASKFTQMMESHILDLAKTGAVSKIAKLLDITDTRIWRVIRYWVEKCRKEADYSHVCNAGIDETSKKGHNYITNFVDLDKRKVMYVANGKDSKTVAEFKKDFEAHKGCPDKIKNITSDMSLAFEVGIKKNFKNSKIIIDKFHVIKYFNDALNKTLRDDIKAGYDFKKSKYIWAKNKENLTPKQAERFKAMNKLRSKTAKAYQMKVAMQEIYRLTDRNKAEAELKKLVSWMKRSRNEHAKKLANTILNHWGNILNYFDNRLTNAILEGINNIIQNIKHTARGFRNYDYFKTVVYLYCGAFTVGVG
jgi:transposase